ncbi:cytochrome c oxidase subunit II [Sphingobacterium hungaricum]|uniref:Cytochrome c oxidase subunit 2 n=1 Tax=Sphingobacterium hungaricum TaxID=2082723 RepID=A0A928UWT5_9SPHI|nr:cytochrome c oxidase subunit II [Sphingobacterium hungaricum]MBE8713418.1 hypothetical protein [Sphingobacterium hungaricum]
MKFKINNRFKSISGCLLAIGLFFATPSFAVQDSVATATDSVAAPVVDSTTAPVDTLAGAAISATDSTSVAAGATTVAAKKVEEEKTVDPQVYKNLVYYILLFLIVCTIIAIILKVISVYELTKKMNGKYNPLSNNTLQAILLFVFLVVFLAFVYYSFKVWGSWAWRDAVTEHGKQIDTMFIVTTVITTFVLVATHILLLTFPYLYRMRANKRAYYYPHNNTIEKIWTIVPSIVLTVLVLFGFFAWRNITNIPEELRNSALQVEVMGEQFMWSVRYPGADGKIGNRNYKMTTSSNPYGIDFNDKSAWDDIQAQDIVLPVNKSVRFHIISKDILHSFYIPDFRVQINAVPGMTNYFQFTPTMTTQEMRDKMDDPKYDFVLLCAKICGEAHYNMQKKVVVVTEEEYKVWLSQQNKYFNEDLQKEFSSSTKEIELNTASLN